MATIGKYTILSQDGFFGWAETGFSGCEMEIKRIKPTDGTLWLYFLNGSCEASVVLESAMQNSQE